MKHPEPIAVLAVGKLTVHVARGMRTLSLSSQGLFNDMLTSRLGAHVATTVSPVAAAMQLANAQSAVPAYQSLLGRHRHSGPRAHKLADRIRELPETDKQSYIDAYSTEERCRGGKIPRRDAEIDESSGSSGRPYNWIRGRRELTEMRRTLSRLATFLYGPDIVTINGFSMGAWATGTNVSRSLARNGLIKSTGPDAAKMLSVFEMLGKERTYIITGYPPFLLELLDFGKRRDFPWHEYRMGGIVGGEAMSETLRTRLLEHFQVVTSAYGASDLDIGVACEFPLSTWIRQQAAQSPGLAQALFGQVRRLPMLFQYDPLDYYVEQNGRGEIVVTVNRPSALSPRLRYNVHDTGGKLEFGKVIGICRQFGLDPLHAAPLPYAGKHPRLPFLFVGGRSDSTISYLGANIYPEDVEQALFGDGPDAERGIIRGFAMETIEDAEGHERPVVHIELQQGRDERELSSEALSRRVVERLTVNSRDFEASLAEDPRAGRIEVRVHRPNAGPFEGMNSQIKRRYIIPSGK